jgi:hypothetical protein
MYSQARGHSVGNLIGNWKWRKEVPINMGPETLHKEFKVDKGRETHEDIAFVVLARNISLKGGYHNTGTC